MHATGHGPPQVSPRSLPPARVLCWLFSSLILRPVAQTLDRSQVHVVHDTGPQAFRGSGNRPDKTDIDHEQSARRRHLGRQRLRAAGGRRFLGKAYALCPRC